MTRQDFINWKQDPVTKEVFASLSLDLELARDQLERSLTQEDTEHLRGYIQAMREFINLDYPGDDNA